MRTNIVLNESLVREAMRYSRARTKRELVDEALAAFVKLRAAEAGRTTPWVSRLGKRIEAVRR